MKTEFIGTCVENPFGDIETLVSIVENEAIEIDRQQFLSACHVDETTIREMQEYPHDFEFYKSDGIYFFCHSAIEHFYA